MNYGIGIVPENPVWVDPCTVLDLLRMKSSFFLSFVRWFSEMLLCVRALRSDSFHSKDVPQRKSERSLCSLNQQELANNADFDADKSSKLMTQAS